MDIERFNDHISQGIALMTDQKYESAKKNLKQQFKLMSNPMMRTYIWVIHVLIWASLMMRWLHLKMLSLRWQMDI